MAITLSTVFSFSVVTRRDSSFILWWVHPVLSKIYRLICMWIVATIVGDYLRSPKVYLWLRCHVVITFKFLISRKLSEQWPSAFFSISCHLFSLVLEVPILPVKAFRCGILCSAEDTLMSSLGQCLSYITPRLYVAARDCHRAYPDTRSVLWTKLTVYTL